MVDRRAPRLIVEIAFLAALAAGLTFADVRTSVIVAVMAAGWVIAAVFEWGAVHARPHYRSGLPPRWYTPAVRLPPPRPLEQLSSGYPAAEAQTDAPTWIASPAMLAEWPVADLEPHEVPPEEQTHAHDVFDSELAVVIDAPDEVVGVAEPGLEEVEEVDELDEVDEVDEIGEVDEPEADDDPEPHEVVSPPSRPESVARPAGPRMARHRIDPLAQAAARSRRFGRRGETANFDAEVPDGPMRPRILPAQSRDE
jgi:hypothetical protein